MKKFGVQLTQEEKNKKIARERKVKAEFKEKLGLIVDQRRDGGAGNTTTGNVARKAFANSGILIHWNYLYKLGLVSQKMHD